MRLFIVYFLPIILFFGCDLFRDEMEIKGTGEPINKEEDGQNKTEEQQNNGEDDAPVEAAEEATEPIEDEEFFFSSKIVMGGRLVSRTWITAEAKAGDKLRITLKGRGQLLHFIEAIYPYDEFYQEHIIDTCGEDVPCPEPVSYPNCFARYQAVHEERVDKINFSDDVLSLPLRIEMNGKIYTIGEVVEYTESEVATEFVIKDEMINKELDYTSIYFVRSFPQEDETVRVGFFGFLDKSKCPDINEQERRFQTFRQRITPTIDYFAKVILKQRRRN